MNGVPEGEFRRRGLAMGASLLVGVTLLLAKFYAYHITRSTAVLSDALESIINVVAGAFALWSVLLAAKPPDESHLYGHGKIEFFSAGFEGALIILAAVGIFRTGLYQLLNPHPIPSLDVGLIIVIGTSLANMLTGVLLVREGRRIRSLTLVADGKHLLTDVYTSAGVVVGLLLVRWTGLLWLDGATACLMGLNILFTGWKLVRESYAGLMDETDPRLLEEICDILIKYRRDIWIDVHRLRAWKSGNILHIDFHLILPRDLSLEESHGEVKTLEAIFKSVYGERTDILIHADPCIDPECKVCSFDPCTLRQKLVQRQSLWRREEIISEERVADRGILDDRS